MRQGRPHLLASALSKWLTSQKRSQQPTQTKKPGWFPLVREKQLHTTNPPPPTPPPQAQSPKLRPAGRTPSRTQSAAAWGIAGPPKGVEPLWLGLDPQTSRIKREATAKCWVATTNCRVGILRVQVSVLGNFRMLRGFNMV